MRWLVLSLVLFLTGCLEKIEETKVPDYIVFCELVSGKRFQFVHIDRVYSPEESPGPGIQGASVSVIGEDTVNFFETVEEDTTGSVVFYMDSTADKWLRPDKRYTLFVSFPDGRELFDTTTIPGEFSILSPHNYDTVTLSSGERLIWTKSKNSVFYIVYLRGPFSDTVISKEDSLSKEVVLFSGDTVSDVFDREKLFEGSGWYMIDVRGENRDAYLWNLNDEPSFDLDWVRGVFGGLVSKRLWVFVRKEAVKK